MKTPLNLREDHSSQPNELSLKPIATSIKDTPNELKPLAYMSHYMTNVTSDKELSDIASTNNLAVN